MSREFGQYLGGCYFHTHVQFAADDASEGTDQVTKLVAPLLEALSPVAYAISSVEACDAGPDTTVVALWEQMPQLREAFKEMETFVARYDAVARAAVKAATSKDAP